METNDTSPTISRQAVSATEPTVEQLLEQGMALEKRGQTDAALQCYDSAIALMPELARAHFNRGTLLLDRGEAQAALQALHTAVHYKPDSAGAHFNIGAAHARLDNHEAALAAYGQALALRPEFAEAAIAMGSELEALGQHEDAVESYRRALKASPGDMDTHAKLIDALKRLGQHEALAQAYGDALACAPDDVDLLYERGMVLWYLGRLHDAASSFRRATELRPGFVDAHCSLGDVCMALQLFNDAVASYRWVLEMEPNNAGVYTNLGSAFKDLGQLEEALANYRRALAIRPDFSVAHSNLLLIQHLLASHSQDELLEEAKRFGATVTRLAPASAALQNRPDPERTLRVGFVSADLRSHPVGYFIENVLAALSAEATRRLTLFAYANATSADEVTERLKRHFAGGWHSVVGMTDEAMDQRIRDDAIDILIDLSGHTGKNRLPVFARKPAPVQISWLGYFATTGVPAMDYLIADPWTLPPTLEGHFTEKILRLPETRLCFTAPNLDLNVISLPALRNGYVTFACFNALPKMNDAVVALWARVLHAVPQSRLHLMAPQLGDSAARATVVARYAAHGIESGRLILQGAVPRADYLATYRKVDLALDPFPYTGGTTTAEALWMGVPVLTLAGSSFLSRQGVGMMMNAGLPDWVANDPEDYLQRAITHANNLPRLAVLRAGLRKQVLESPLFDAPRFARHLEAALRTVWKDWCQTTNAPRT
ncbi:tetratricopeptide repeat protein [Polaromonas sp. YR568]|uniref:tetratricopeptide repeat protein n=1 Tax=Polaromonas sp. YR568 TaxID=1855301 RepID=UPI003138374C